MVTRHMLFGISDDVLDGFRSVGKCSVKQGGEIRQRVSLELLSSRKRSRTDPSPSSSMDTYFTQGSLGGDSFIIG